MRQFSRALAEQIRAISSPSPPIPRQVPNADRPPALQRVWSGFSGDNSHPQTARFNRCCSAPEYPSALPWTVDKPASRLLRASTLSYRARARDHGILIITQPRDGGLHRASTHLSRSGPPSNGHGRTCSCVALFLSARMTDRNPITIITRPDDNHGDQLHRHHPYIVASAMPN